MYIHGRKDDVGVVWNLWGGCTSSGQRAGLPKFGLKREANALERATIGVSPVCMVRRVVSWCAANTRKLAVCVGGGAVVL